MLRNPSCGARKNLRALLALFLDFFDRCAHPCSLHRLRRAPRRGPRRIRRSGSNPVFPHKKTKAAALLDDCFFSWRRRRDLNPRAGYPTYSLSRGAPSPLGYFCMVKFILCHICRLYSSGNRPVKIIWRREWDSNPRCLATRRFSRPFRYDHFGISPYSAKVILSHQSTYVKHK